MVLKVVQARQLVSCHRPGQEVLVGVVGGDTGGNDDAHAPAGLEQDPHTLHDDPIRVDVAPTGEEEGAASTQEAPLVLGGVQGIAVGLPAVGLFLGQLGDGQLAPWRVGRLGNLRVARREKLLLLKLDALPRWIARHYVETAGNSE